MLEDATVNPDIRPIVAAMKIKITRYLPISALNSLKSRFLKGFFILNLHFLLLSHEILPHDVSPPHLRSAAGRLCHSCIAPSPSFGGRSSAPFQYASSMHGCLLTNPSLRRILYFRLYRCVVRHHHEA